MTQVQVFHQKFNALSRELEGFEHVATIDITPDTCTELWKLEQAWRWTNNIDGSWSQGELIPEIWSNGKPTGGLIENTDYNPNTTVHVALPTHCGRTYGLRSSMVGDRFVIDSKTFEVASAGFKLLETSDD